MRWWTTAFAAALTVTAGTALADPALEELLSRARRIQDEAARGGVPDWIRALPTVPLSRIQDLSDQADKIGNQAVGLQPNGKPLSSTSMDRRVELLVSFALGDAALRDILRDIAGRQDVVAVFRGFDSSQGFAGLLKKIKTLLEGMDPVPNVVIDPEPFRRLDATTAPEAVVVEGDQVLAHARGTVAIDTLLADVAKGRRGDLGVWGPTVAVTEPDLVEVITQRVQSMDMTAMRDRAVQRFWKQARFFELAAAPANRVREIDPSRVLQQDILTPDGKVVAHAGQRLNPLEKLPWHFSLVVFDGRSPEQIDQVRKVLAGSPGRQWTLITTAVERDDGFKDLVRIQDQLNSRVYLLQPGMVENLGLEFVPAVVEAVNGKLRVTEFATRQ
ncbi:hypothetical protein FZ983_27210 [Azospirillum sp. B21]|nr:hypothetical protein FZ983_27210 [Azospirillum sp. B21]